MPAVTTIDGCPVQLPYKITLAPQMGDEALLLGLALVAAVIALVFTHQKRVR